MNLELIQRAVMAGRYRFTDHGEEERDADDLTETEVLGGTADGKIIEDYPTALPMPACLVLGQLPDGAPLHTVWAYDAQNDYAVLITVYRPDPSRWSADFHVRVRR